MRICGWVKLIALVWRSENLGLGFLDWGKLDAAEIIYVSGFEALRLGDLCFQFQYRYWRISFVNLSLREC